MKIRVTGRARLSLEGGISFVVEGANVAAVEAALNDSSDKAIEAAIETAVRGLSTRWGDLEFEVESIAEVQP